MNILQINSGISRYDYVNEIGTVSFSIKLHVGGFGQDISDELSLNKIPYTPTKGDKIFFLPNVNVPRVKFKNVCVEHNVKNVRDFNQATVFFGSKKSLNEMTSTNWLYKCPIKEFLAFFELVKPKMDEYDIEKVETSLEFYTEDLIAVDYNLKEMINSEHSIIKDETFGYSENLMIVKEEYQELYKFLQDKTILDESSVINVLNGEDATEIDKVMFDHLSEMLDSSDTDNHVLAMEIMANSKYTESLIYLELLFYKYAYNIGSSKTKTHVNFKSLISYLGKDKNYLDTSIDKVVNSLIDKGQLTSDNLDILLTYASKDIQNRGDSTFFTVKTISVVPDLLAKLNSNYTYGIQEDFVNPVSEILTVEEVIEDITEEIPESEFATEDNFEVASEKEVSHMLYGVDNEDIEVSLTIEEEEEDDTDVLEPEPVSEVSESELNNNQIDTNGTPDIDWF
jgi:hypothetical protein